MTMKEYILRHAIPIAYDSPTEVPRIRLMKDLEHYLPTMCEAIHKSLGSQNLEATYQRCLAMDLREAGLDVLSEVEIPIMWRGKKVATRRADLIVRTPDGATAVLELKALTTLLSDKNLQQLKYYMKYFFIQCGFLINFPHDVGFPDLVEVDIDLNSETSTTYNFESTALCGGAVQCDAIKGFKNVNTDVQITKAVWCEALDEMPANTDESVTDSWGEAGDENLGGDTGSGDDDEDSWQ